MNIAVIFAGGVGARMHSKDKPKQFLVLSGKPIIIYTLEHFEYNKNIDAIVVVCVEGWEGYLRDLLHKYGITKVKSIVPGGISGQQSIYNGLLAAKEIAGNNKSIVLIHDGVRPLINQDVINSNIESVKKHGSAITSSLAKETFLLVDPESNQINSTVDRNKSRIAKAPQSFWLDDILVAHSRAISDGKNNFIDSCSLMHSYGYQIYLVDGPSENIKITTPEDFYMMRAFLEAKENSQLYTMD